MSEAGKRLIESARQALDFAKETADTSSFRVHEFSDNNDMPKRRKNQHVIEREHGWAVRGEGNIKNTRVVPTQKEALRIATEIAKNQGTEVVIHGLDGSVIRKSSFAKEKLNPPKS